MSYYPEPELSYMWIGTIPYNDQLLDFLMAIPYQQSYVTPVNEPGNEHYEIYMHFQYPAPIPSTIGHWESAEEIKH